MEFALLSYKSFIKSDYQLVQNHIQCPTLANKQGSCCPKHDELHGPKKTLGMSIYTTRISKVSFQDKTANSQGHKSRSSYIGTRSRRDFACHMSRTSPLKDMF